MNSGPPAEVNRAMGLAMAGRFAEAEPLFRAYAKNNSRDPRGHFNHGKVLRDLGRDDAALSAFRRAIKLEPGFAEAHLNIGNIAFEHSDLRTAADAYRRAWQARKNYHLALGHLVHVRQMICDWAGLDIEEAEVLRAVRAGETVVPPFHFLAMHSTAIDQLLCARRYAARFSAASRGAHSSYRDRNAPIRIGYLSADFHSHATAFLMAELFERHDRAVFEVVGYSYGPDDGSAMRRRLMNGFDRFVDFRLSTDAQAADRIREDGIDILMDLKGYTQFARPQILAFRPAPIQVGFIGYPGTTGADFIDYLIADAFVAPCEHQPFYSEKLVHLPVCYQPNDRKRVISPRRPSRKECGLPETGVVYCCFNNSYKITPVVFAIWMRILGAVPGSSLWLLEANPLAKAALRREARAARVDPDRLVFAPRWPLAEHLARYALADLFLDTLPVNAHTTASDALWAGLPVLTCAGQSFAGRVAGSLLHAVGLPDMVVETLEHYEATAVMLGNNRHVVAGIRDRLAESRETASLFDTDRFTSNLESAYCRMVDIHVRGQTPEPFAVAEVQAIGC